MKINSTLIKPVNFGISVSPKLKYTIFKETKKFFSRKEASNLLSLIECSSDRYRLYGFKMSVPNKRGRNIFCDIFVKSKQKDGKICLIHGLIGKLKSKQIQYKNLADLLKKI